MSGRRRLGVTIIVCAMTFIVLLLVADPIGDTLVANGIPKAIIGVVLVLVVAALFGVPIAMYARGRGRRLQRSRTDQAARIESWTARAGWHPAAWQGEPPAVLHRAGTRSCDPTVSVTGEVSGLGAGMSLWRQTFANIGSPVTATALWLVLVIDGVPPGTHFAMGKVTGTGFVSRMPSRWFGLPPMSLVRTAPVHPWGITSVAVWPGRGVAPPSAWADIARELDATAGWLLLHDGRLEIAMRADRGDVGPERLVAVARRVVGRIRGATLR